MEEVEPSVPYEERNPRYVLFPNENPKVICIPAHILERKLKWLVRIIGRDYIAEYLGTMIFITFALGGSAQAFYTKNNCDAWAQESIGATLGIFFGLYTCIGVSGGHLNPAVSLAMALVGRFEWKKVPLYWLAQILGSFTASFIVYLYYFDSYQKWDDGRHIFGTGNESYRVWTTNPQDSVGIANLFWDQFYSTFLLLFLILAVFDKPNSGLIHYLKPMGVAIIILAVSACFSFNCGGAMNPIRDFPPRIFAAMLWGARVFRIHDYYFLIPIFAPLTGGPLGAVIYIALIETHHYPEKTNSREEAKPLISSTSYNPYGTQNTPNRTPVN